jgi:hypothetical protein
LDVRANTDVDQGQRAQVFAEADLPGVAASGWSRQRLRLLGHGSDAPTPGGQAPARNSQDDL